MAEAEIAFIGGSGLYDIDGLTDAEQVIIDTPFGQPSDAVTVGTLEGRACRFPSPPREGTSAFAE